MTRKTAFRVLFAFAAVAPSVVLPKLAHAQQGTLAVPGTPPAGTDRAEYPDVPRGHWAYQAIDRLSRAGIIEGLPNGTYSGGKPMTRYEFAVAIARILDKIHGGDGIVGPQGLQGVPGQAGPIGPQGAAADVANFVTRAELNDLLANLRREFADELAKLGSRVGALEDRTTALESRVTMPPRVTVTPSLLYRTGGASYISQTATRGGRFFGPDAPGRTIFGGGAALGGGAGVTGAALGAGNVNPGTAGAPGVLPDLPRRFMPNTRTAAENSRYSYTDFELRLTDRVTDRLSANAALRSIGSTQEDPWGPATSGLWAREAYAVADLSDRSFIGLKGLSATFGRQRTKIAQGLLYDNDLSPTDQINLSFNLGPVALSGFVGSTNDETFAANGGNGGFGNTNPYLSTGAVNFLGTSGVGRNNATFFRGQNAGPAGGSGAFVGFAGQPGSVPGIGGSAYPNDSEGLIHGAVNLFRIAGQPVSLGLTREFNGVQDQRGDSADLTVPLFNRLVGFEYVRQRRYQDGESTHGNPHAYNVTVPVLRARALDLNFAYGKADSKFEYFASSAANPFARTYAEALFDRPMALGAPMIDGRFFGNTAARLAGAPAYAAAKEVYDFNGTVRIPVSFLRRLPLDFRYYQAYGSRLAGPGGHKNALDLGQVYSVGTTFNVTPGLDLEFKYGHYNVPGPYPSIHYFRVGANVGF